MMLVHRKIRTLALTWREVGEREEENIYKTSVVGRASNPVRLQRLNDLNFDSASKSVFLVPTASKKDFFREQE